MPGATHTKYGLVGELSVMLLRAFWTSVKSPPDLATTITLWYRCGLLGLISKAAAPDGVSDTDGNILAAITTAMQARAMSNVARLGKRKLRFTASLLG